MYWYCACGNFAYMIFCMWILKLCTLMYICLSRCKKQFPTLSLVLLHFPPLCPFGFSTWSLGLIKPSELCQARFLFRVHKPISFCFLRSGQAVRLAPNLPGAFAVMKTGLSSAKPCVSFKTAVAGTPNKKLLEQVCLQATRSILFSVCSCLM